MARGLLLHIFSEWEQSSDTNVIRGLIFKPSEADGVDTFDFGTDPAFDHAYCMGKCAAHSGCVAYTKFASWYSDSNFMSACVGRSNRYNTIEPDSATLSAVMTGSYTFYVHPSSAVNCFC